MPKYTNRKTSGSTGNKKYIPTLKDGFNNFLLFSFKLPLGVLLDQDGVNIENLIGLLEKSNKETISVAQLIRYAFSVYEDDIVEEALTFVFNPDEERSVIQLGFLLESFEKFNAKNNSPENKKVNDELIDLIKKLYFK